MHVSACDRVPVEDQPNNRCVLLLPFYFRVVLFLTENAVPLRVLGMLMVLLQGFKLRAVMSGFKGTQMNAGA